MHSFQIEAPLFTQYILNALYFYIAAAQMQTAVTVHLKSKQLLLFVVALHIAFRIISYQSAGRCD